MMTATITAIRMTVPIATITTKDDNGLIVTEILQEMFLVNDMYHKSAAYFIIVGFEYK